MVLRENDPLSLKVLRDLLARCSGKAVDERTELLLDLGSQTWELYRERVDDDRDNLVKRVLDFQVELIADRAQRLSVWVLQQVSSGDGDQRRKAV